MANRQEKERKSEKSNLLSDYENEAVFSVLGRGCVVSFTLQFTQLSSQLSVTQSDFTKVFSIFTKSITFSLEQVTSTKPD